jgi:two-component system sensor histidine kinase MprB
LATRFGDLSFQTRLTLVAALAVAIAIIGPGLVLYQLVHNALYSQVDQYLAQRAATAHVEQTSPRAVQATIAPDELGQGVAAPQLIDPHGMLPSNSPPLVFATPQDEQVASGEAPSYLRDELVRGHHLRVLVSKVPDQPYAIQLIRSLDEADQIMTYLKLVLIVLAVCAIPLGAVLGRLVARAALGPLHRLRAAVDRVTETRDMTERVPDSGRDEVGRLAAHFNAMLGAIDQSLRTQRQLVADASHELRTPLASLRTNIEVLQRSPNLPSPDRERLLHDVVAQVEQLTQLIQDLIDLARGDQAPETKEEVRLDSIVSDAVERAVTNWPAVRFRTDLRELIVTGDARRLDRAVSNLLDNAGKWSPPGEVVEVRVTDHQVVVRDHGPGIAADDLPYIFDRFWRAPTSRAMPGSGLGLAIVRQVAETHGAVVTAERPDGGGTLMRLEFLNPDS